MTDAFTRVSGAIESVGVFMSNVIDRTRIAAVGRIVCARKKMLKRSVFILRRDARLSEDDGRKKRERERDRKKKERERERDKLGNNRKKRNTERDRGRKDERKRERENKNQTCGRTSSRV